MIKKTNASADRKWRRAYRLLKVVITLGIGLIQGCTDSGPPNDDRHLRVAFDGAPRNIDPLSASSVYSVGIVLAAYETLFDYQYLSKSLLLKPSLASEMPVVSDDGLSVTIKLRNNSYFADNEIFENGKGRVVTAGDVAYSILRHFDPRLRGQGAWLWRDLIKGIGSWKGDYEQLPEGIIVLSDHEISFRLNRSSPQFVHTLTTGLSAIIPAEFRLRSQSILQYSSVGSGPFKVVQLDSSRATLVRNENYAKVLFDPIAEGFDSNIHDTRIKKFQGARLPLPSRVTIEFIEQPSTRWISLDNGELDVMVIGDEFLDPMLDDDLRLKSEHAERFGINTYLANEMIMMRFNMNDSALGESQNPIENERRRQLRCAIANAVDWPARNDAFYGGDAILYSGVIPPTLPEYEARKNAYGNLNDQNIKSLFESFHAENALPSLTFGHTTSVLGRQNFEMFKSSMVKVGYPIELIEGIAYATFGEVLRGAHGGRHLITQSSWTLDYGDAENTLQLFYGPNSSPGANISNYDNDRYNELFETFQLSQNLNLRMELVDKLHKQLAYDCPYSGSATRERVVISNLDVVVHPNHDATKIGRYFKYAGFD